MSKADTRRVPHGWARLKTMGETTTFQIAVSRETGMFATWPVNSTDEWVEMQEHPDLKAAEAFVANMNLKADYVDAVIFEKGLNGEFPNFYPVKVRRGNYGWVDERGKRVYEDLLQPIPADAMEQIGALAITFVDAVRTIRAARKEALDLVKKLPRL